MNRFLDLQFIIGCYFTITGAIILLSSFSSTGTSGYNQVINFYSGLGITAFGVFMLLTFWLRSKQQNND